MEDQKIKVSILLMGKWDTRWFFSTLNEKIVHAEFHQLKKKFRACYLCLKFYKYVFSYI